MSGYLRTGQATNQIQREAGLLTVNQTRYCGEKKLQRTQAEMFTSHQGCSRGRPAERSVQLVHFVLQGDRWSSCFAHPFGHDVPLGR